MDTDLPSLLMAAIGICIVLAGIIVGTIVLSTQYPGFTIPAAPYLLLLLAVLIVVFAAVVVVTGLDAEENRGRPR
ncbi:MAG: hypothetical protein LUO87_04095 [Methanomicrobiales archaeon]|nr:hypothetical protein [Methanomicrobiales archaeon]MDD1660354.1 hypothetical protein [Methanomicrobiales archaeon]